MSAQVLATSLAVAGDEQSPSRAVWVVAGVGQHDEDMRRERGIKLMDDA